jgi:hypothetical protein
MKYKLGMAHAILLIMVMTYWDCGFVTNSGKQKRNAKESMREQRRIEKDMKQINRTKSYNNRSIQERRKSSREQENNKETNTKRL